MTTEFGKADDTGQKENEGTNFGQTSGQTDSGSVTDNQGITAEQLEALQVRDAAAQAHIPDLERENGELRDKVVELENNLASATQLDDVLDRISTGSDGQGNLDQAAVTQLVERTLEQKQTVATEEGNWTDVYNTLRDTYGDWTTADAKVQERCVELDVTLQDATQMARTNPKAFKSLFLPAESINVDRSSGVRAEGSGQSVTGNTHTGETRDQAWYNKQRKEDSKTYWSVENQAQLRRDLHE